MEVIVKASYILIDGMVPVSDIIIILHNDKQYMCIINNINSRLKYTRHWQLGKSKKSFQFHVNLLVKQIYVYIYGISNLRLQFHTTVRPRFYADGGRKAKLTKNRVNAGSA